MKTLFQYIGRELRGFRSIHGMKPADAIVVDLHHLLFDVAVSARTDVEFWPLLKSSIEKRLSLCTGYKKLIFVLPGMNPCSKWMANVNTRRDPSEYERFAFDVSQFYPGSTFLVKLKCLLAKTFVYSSPLCPTVEIYGPSTRRQAWMSTFDSIQSLSPANSVSVFSTNSAFVLRYMQMFDSARNLPHLSLVVNDQRSSSFRYIDAQAVSSSAKASCSDLSSFVLLNLLLKNEFVPGVGLPDDVTVADLLALAKSFHEKGFGPVASGNTLDLQSMAPFFRHVNQSVPSQAPDEQEEKKAFAYLVGLHHAINSGVSGDVSEDAFWYHYPYDSPPSLLGLANACDSTTKEGLVQLVSLSRGFRSIDMCPAEYLMFQVPKDKWNRVDRRLKGLEKQFVDVFEKSAHRAKLSITEVRAVLTQTNEICGHVREKGRYFPRNTL